MLKALSSSLLLTICLHYFSFFLKMKAALVFLFALCVPIHLVFCKDCSETAICGKGHACVKLNGILTCEPFAHKGKKCSPGDALQSEGQIYESFPPCHPNKGLQCVFKGRYACIKQEGLISSAVAEVL
ncbi:uncharacterized protein [Parasteatoda tepidariorum]|uniref:uncharacterized protein isoform X1 n=1 Tax=Parasteatoda tepidariorum TaxID=114398 RepID=UPI000A2C0304